MLLIYPRIEISHESCTQLVRGEPGSEHLYSIDPVKMAVLWRGENAKTLHIVDRDGVADGTVRNRDVIRKMIGAVDIPVQVGGGLRNFEEVQALFALGVYRVVIGTAAVENPGLVERLIREFGSRKTAISIEAKDGAVMVEGGARKTDMTPLDLTKRMKKIGVSRVVYADLGESDRLTDEFYNTLKQLAIETKVRITASDGVAGYQDLIRLQELEKYGVDSVIIGQPLYENRFPCQRLWRLNEKELTDLGPTRRA